ncbi:MAG: hypothetical protein H7101_06590 [Deinococcales bacterium]|nr:hypothetical protein [Chitinophagaceae bacterium]
MKKTILYINIFCLLFSISGFAQIEGVKSNIATIGRYTNKGIELRWIPDNKTILRLGFDNSFTIERSDFGANKFSTVATIKAFDKSKWEKMIAEEKDTTVRNNLELGMEFLFVEKKKEKTAINLDAGIAELNEQKATEDMMYAVFVLTAIKDGKVAEALGLGWVDNTAQAGKTYNYTVKLNAKSAIYTIENGMVTVKAAFDPNQFKNEVFVYAGDKNLSFVWSSNPKLSGYYVERALENETTFKPLNTTPFYDTKGADFEGTINGSFKDDSLINYKWYKYRFYGNTAFGDKILFAEVKGMPKDLTPPDAPILKLPKHTKPKEVLVAWDMYGNISDLKGFLVARSNKDSGNFSILHKALLPKQTRTFVDTSFHLDENNYYTVYAFDTAGNISAAYPAYVALIDSTPPAKPIIVSAIADSIGVVTLIIKQGKEKDLKGYRLFKSNGIEHELSVIEEAFKKDKTDTTSYKLIFKDTVGLNSLTPEIFYQVKALDYNYNQSAFSEKIRVKRPDTIPPITPVFTNVIVKEKQIELYFAPSESNDVKEQIAYRKTDINAEWKILLKLTPGQKQLIDTTVKTGITYYYTIKAVDESNLYSNYANTVYGKPYDSGIRPIVTNLSSKIVDKKVVLSWTYPQAYKGATFAIYKKNEKGNLLQYQKVTDTFFTDNNTSKDNSYAIKVFTIDGGQSPLSVIISQKNE